ncbi:SSI family serine proteinase inhibitor [Streptacidiphilus monticola]|uniref:SSI family serine proteinase inhibitor n=1 Tax=Streptacidiphilus monticola TaxID=2161674 RepID=A0ABW1G5N3_9ACTN
MSLRRNVLAAVVAGTALTLTGAATVADATTEPSGGGATELLLTLEHPSPDEGLPARPSRSVTLTCDPVGGTHPDPARACADLEASKGTLELPSDQACILLYSPVVATATGTWHGRAVNWKRRFGNDCELRVRTRSLFRF